MAGDDVLLAAACTRCPPRIAPQSRPSQNPSDFASATPKFPCGSQLATSRTSPNSQFPRQRPPGALIPAPHRMHLVRIAPQSHPGVHRGSSTTTLRLPVGAPPRSLPPPYPYPPHCSVFRHHTLYHTLRSPRDPSPRALTFPPSRPLFPRLPASGNSKVYSYSLRIPSDSVRLRPTPSRGPEACTAWLTSVSRKQLEMECLISSFTFSFSASAFLPPRPYSAVPSAVVPNSTI